MQQKFDVFLNFRGDDVRYSSLSHLLGALNQASLEIFVDYKIKRGDEISLALMSAIENSKLAITIFSKNYATSRWCLNELVKIIECTENPRIKQIVIPVYYHVTSIEVKSQSGSFTEAFTDHENSAYLENRREVPIWKAAVKRAGGLSGRSVKEKSPEYDVVVDIVNDVLIALGRPPMENKVDGSYNSVRLIHTLELQVKGNIWTPPPSSSEGIRIENLDSFLNMLKRHFHPSSSLPLEWNPQANSSYSQALAYVQTEGSTEWKHQTNSSNTQAPKYGHEGSKSTETSSGPATEWKSKASTYGRSEGSNSRGTSSASVQNTSYPTTGELYLPDARDKVVLFVTSSRVDKVIAEHCDAVREVLEGYGVSFVVRNTSKTSHRKALQDVLKGKPMKLPALFVKGDFIGGYEEIKKFKESGELVEILEDFSVRNREWSYKLLDPKYGHSEGSKNMEASSGPATEWKSKASTYGQSEGSKSTGKSSSGSVQNRSYPTTGDELFLASGVDKVVLFVTSSRIVQVTSEHCDQIREVLGEYGVSYDERDTSNYSHRKELHDVLKGKPVKLPELFVKGEYVGGFEQMKMLKESDELGRILQDFSARNGIFLLKPWDVDHPCAQRRLKRDLANIEEFFFCDCNF